jgi:hypothetical protein
MMNIMWYCEPKQNNSVRSGELRMMTFVTFLPFYTNIIQDLIKMVLNPDFWLLVYFDRLGLIFNGKFKFSDI